MYKILIADDDLYIRKGMYQIIDWAENGFEIIGDVTDGREAIDFIKEKAPHLLIADINMPGLDGLELIRELNAKKMNVKTIFLTGYRDFNYAKEAIKNKAKGYLNKPVDEKELIDLLNEIKVEFMNDKRFEEGITALKEKVLRTLLNSQSEYDNLFNHIYEYDTDFDENRTYNVILAEMDIEEELGDEATRTASNLLWYKVKTIVGEIINRYQTGYLLDNNNKQFCIVLHNEKLELTNENIKKIAEEIRREVKELTGITMTLGVGRNVCGISNLYITYNDSIKSLNNLFIFGRDRVIFPDSDSPNNSISNSEIRHAVDEVLKGIDEYDINRIYNDISKLFDKIKLESISDLIVKDSIIEIIIQINKGIREMHGEISQAFGENFSLYDKLNKKFTLSELEDWIKSIIGSYCAYIGKLKEDRPNELIEKMLDYINKNYGTDLSLKSISKEFFVNSSYLGQLFKKDVGDSFNDFLSRVRVENAKKLLKTTDLKVYEISEKVGFKDVQYFYKVYKKITGIHPTSLRLK